jgi:DNA-binding transcriptional regulator YiaG
MPDPKEELRVYVRCHADYQEARSAVSLCGGAWFRAIRIGMNLSARKLAMELDVTASYISKIENGKLPLGADLAAKLLKLTEEK